MKLWTPFTRSGQFLKTHWKTIAIVVGSSFALVTTGALVYRYYRRKTTVVEDIACMQEDAQSRAKAKLKKLLRAPNVHCQDLDRVEEIIDYLIVDGPEQLQIVADFDHTLTGLTHNGASVPSCHSVVESCPHLPDWFKEKALGLKEYYLAIEMNPSMSREEKLPFMIEWWDKAHELMISAGIRREDIQASVKLSNLYLRDGSANMLSVLHEQRIPLLIFSAGVGDVITETLEQRYKLYDNIHVISNWMDFNHEGVLVGFKGEVIHVYNKNSHAVENASYFDSIRQRHNVVLLGDSLGDLDIAEGIPHKENLLTIGFLNFHVEESLPAYMKKYDIVLVSENSVELTNCLIDNVILSRK